MTDSVVGRKIATNPSVPISDEWLTEEEAISYLKLDTRKGDAKERIRNLLRRKGLPYYELARGLRQYRRCDIDAWRLAQRRGPKAPGMRTA